MLSDEIVRFVSGVSLAVVATSDSAGQPHVALGRGPRIEGDTLVLENWFCQTTLANVEQNRRVALAVMEPSSGTGYQFLGTVTGSSNTAILNGYVPGDEPPGEPQVRTRLVVRVDDVLAFCSGIHTDQSLITGRVSGVLQERRGP